MLPEQHLVYIDQFGKTAALLKEYRVEYAYYVELQRKLRQLQTDEREKAQRTDLLSYQINEISSAALFPDEEEELQSAKKKMQNSVKIIEALHIAHDLLQGTEESDGILSMLDQTQEQFQMLEVYYPQIKSDRILDMRYELEEVRENLRDALSDAEMDPAVLDRIEEFEDQVCAELTFLDMPSVRFIVHAETVELDETGIDRMEFYISTNPGEPPKPIGKIASGGELSRIMLSLKNVIAEGDRVGTLIFDEVDTGVSGRAAQKIGRKLKQASAGRQIICVTHLAQVAAFADTHLLIAKIVRDGRTFTTVNALPQEERVQELARIMGGENLTPTVLASARELILQAKENDNGR